MRTAKYKIIETDDNHFQYQLIAKNGRVILTSVKQKTIDDVNNLIKRTQLYGKDMFNFDLLQNNNFKLYFNVTENNDHVIASSNEYNNETELITACNIIMDNCQTTSIQYVINNDPLPTMKPIEKELKTSCEW